MHQPSSLLCPKGASYFHDLSIQENRFYSPRSLGRIPRKRDAVDFFRDEAGTIPSSRGFKTDHYLPKERKLQMGCNARALLRCNRTGCPSETITPYHHLSITPAFVPPFPQRHFLLLRAFNTRKLFFQRPLLGTNASKKRRMSSFFEMKR